MRRFGQCYVQAFNLRHRRVGPLWQGRFKSCLVESDAYLMRVYRYIELNPVRAAMTARAEDYQWSSVHTNLGLRTDPLVTPHPLFLSIHDDPAQRAALYRTWLREGISDDDVLALRTHLHQQRALGSPIFQAMVERTLGRPAKVRPQGRPRQIRATMD
jgi:putative transposase